MVRKRYKTVLNELDRRKTSLQGTLPASFMYLYKKFETSPLKSMIRIKIGSDVHYVVLYLKYLKRIFSIGCYT